LQTREQHIRRDKATSNICTAQALLANMSAFYAIFHGKSGLFDISSRINLLAFNLQNELEKIGYRFVNNPTEIFDTVTINAEESGVSAEEIVYYFEQNGINLRKIDSNSVGVTINETTNLADLEELLNHFSNLKCCKQSFDISKLNWVNNEILNLSMNKNLRRNNFKDILNQDIFNKYSSESQILRYLYHLQLKDISLCNSMISLGSCTMKLNATSELVKI